MKQLYVPHNLTIRENPQCVVEVIEDGEYGEGTDRPGMPYSRIIGSFATVHHAKRVYPHAQIDEAFSTAFSNHIAAAAERITNTVAPSNMDTEVEPDPTFDAAHEIRYDNQGVPY